jgi:hypothetical protein
MTRQNTIRVAAAAARLAVIKRFCIGALRGAAAVSALTAIIALKAAIYYSGFH